MYCLICLTNRIKANHPKGLVRHERTHTEAFICILCGKPTWSSTALVEHCQAEHKEKSKHICRVCGFYNFTEAMLKQHTLQVHMKGTKEYQCEQCDFKTSIQSTFAAHVRKHKKQCFVCEDCGKECTTQQALASHRRCHEVKILTHPDLSMSISTKGASQPVSMLLLPKTVCPRFSSQHPRAHPHQRETLPVYRLWPMFWLSELFDQTHSKPTHPRGPDAV